MHFLVTFVSKYGLWVNQTAQDPVYNACYVSRLEHCDTFVTAQSITSQWGQWTGRVEHGLEKASLIEWKGTKLHFSAHGQIFPVLYKKIEEGCYLTGKVHALYVQLSRTNLCHHPWKVFQVVELRKATERNPEQCLLSQNKQYVHYFLWYWARYITLSTSHTWLRTENELPLFS